MSNTDGTLIKRIRAINNVRLVAICDSSMLVWSLFPIVMLLAKVIGLSSYLTNGIIGTMLYLSGCIGMIFGGIFITRIIHKYSLCCSNNSAVIERFQPLLAVFIFTLWCLLCTLLAKEKRIGFYGYDSFRDSFFTFFFFIGFYFSGIVLSTSAPKNQKSIIALPVVASYIGAIELLFQVEIMAKRILGEYLLISFVVALFLCIRNQTKKPLLVYLLTIFLLLLICINGDPESTILVLLFLVIFFLYSTSRKTTMNIKGIFLFLLLVVYVMGVFLFLQLKDISLQSFMMSFGNILSTRMEIWIKANHFIMDSPIVGVGLQNTMLIADSILLQLGMYLGVPGMLIFFYYTLVSHKNCDDSAAKILMLIILLLMLVSGSTYYLTGFLFFTLGVVWDINDTCKNFHTTS